MEIIINGIQSTGWPESTSRPLQSSIEVGKYNFFITVPLVQVDGIFDSRSLL